MLELGRDSLLLFCVMKMSDVEAIVSGGSSRAKFSEVRSPLRTQVAGYGARPGGRPRRPGQGELTGFSLESTGFFPQQLQSDI